MTLRSSLEPANDLSWLNARSMASFQAIEQYMEYGEDASIAPSFGPDTTLEHGLEFLTDGTMSAQSPVPTPENTSGTRDAMETDIRELTELSLSAYRVTTDAGIPSTDELFAMTQSVLKVLARITSTVQQQQQKNEVSVPGNGNQDSQPVVHHGPRTAISLVLQAVSVCEQIYETFVHTCSVLRSELELHTQRGSGSGSGSDVNQNDHRMSDARAVMTVELINYLFEKMSRAQKQLLAAALTTDDASSSTPESISTEGSTTSLAVPSDPLSGCSTSVIPILTHRVHRKHPQLQNYIQAIRDLTRNKDSDQDHFTHLNYILGSTQEGRFLCLGHHHSLYVVGFFRVVDRWHSDGAPNLQSLHLKAFEDVFREHPSLGSGGLGRGESTKTPRPQTRNVALLHSLKTPLAWPGRGCQHPATHSRLGTGRYKYALWVHDFPQPFFAWLVPSHVAALSRLRPNRAMLNLLQRRPRSPGLLLIASAAAASLLLVVLYTHKLTVPSVLRYGEVSVDEAAPVDTPDVSDAEAPETSLADIQYDVPSGDRRLVVVIPANGPSPALCKAMLSAVAMGYPMPIIINWGVSPEDVFPGKKNVGSHQLKISGLLTFLDEINHASTHEDDRLDDNDLMVMVDAFDIWFQTPPDVLIRRYHEANRRMNERLLSQWTGKKEDMPFEQTIVISATKRCWPDDAPSSLHCDELPDSPLREDLYGEHTDQDMGDFWATLHNRRPKYINTGNIMGPIGDLRRYVRRVNQKLESKVVNHDDYYFKSDQAFFGNIWAEQEIYRKWLFQRNPREDEGSGKRPFMMDRDLEYHVGLDYAQNLCLPTTNEEDDGEFIALGDTEHIENKSRQFNITPTRLTGVPEDLALSPNPLAILPSLESIPDWSDLPLYADYYTTSVPAMLHHNTNRGEGKARIKTWWHKPWFFPYLRDLVMARISPDDDAERTPLGTFKAKGGDVVYWPPNRGQSSEGLPTGEWEDMCRDPQDPTTHWSKEVFRDGKGGLGGEGADN
ncbi:hypothetical protein ACRALDRAFT_1070608 [Sodiomyces alcalophilus JCM 7366]|uniref:uncharacterized protein n=1 Tax=Sodiomyces alcalophilus JCM 7366 TaxID=591952 RepID=UPI0039B4181E